MQISDGTVRQLHEKVVALVCFDVFTILLHARCCFSHPVFTVVTLFSIVNKQPLRMFRVQEEYRSDQPNDA